MLVFRFECTFIYPSVIMGTTFTVHEAWTPPLVTVTVFDPVVEYDVTKVCEVPELGLAPLEIGASQLHAPEAVLLPTKVIAWPTRAGFGETLLHVGAALRAKFTVQLRAC